MHRAGAGPCPRSPPAAGLEVSGCVTTTRLGKPSTGWKGIACLTDRANQERLRGEFEFAAGLFDEIMIDDFWFTDCTCPACDAARRAKTVTIGGAAFPVAGDTWEDYRGELMLQLSRRVRARGGQEGQPASAGDRQVPALV